MVTFHLLYSSSFLLRSSSCIMRMASSSFLFFSSSCLSISSCLSLYFWFFLSASSACSLICSSLASLYLALCSFRTFFFIYY